MENKAETTPPQPDPSDSTETLTGKFVRPETVSPDSNNVSSSNDDASLEADELCDTIVLLDDQSESKDTESEAEDGVLIYTRTNVHDSDSSSHWSQPWSRNAELHSNSRESQWSTPVGNTPSDWTEERSLVYDVDTCVSTWLSQFNKPIITGAGLANLGNTCFLNAVLQCFIHTVPLLVGVLTDMHLVHFNCNKEEFCILCSLRELVEVSLVSTNKVYSPWRLFDNLSYFSSSFQRYQQEDAHEFLQCFLDKLESHYDSKRKENEPSQSDNLVKKVFGGRLISKLKCCNCGHVSDTYEPSIDLSLEIEDAESLLSALQSFTKVEKIEDPETKFTCEECKEQVSIEKQLAFDQTPSVAAFHLKRFKTDGCFVEKIDKHVSFPLDLDLLPFTGGCINNEEELRYALYAIVVHIGLTSTSGHYYCFIRISPDMWCKFDDSKVVLVREDFVLSQEAYILFYAREGTPWFSSFVEAQKLYLESTILNTSPKSVLDNIGTSSVSPNPPEQFISVCNEAGDASGSNNQVIESDEIKDSSGSRIIVIECNQDHDNSHGTFVAAPLLAGGSSDVSLSEAKSEVSPSFLVENQSQEVLPPKNSLNVTPQTPLRSPSPEIYREDQPDAGFSFPRGRLRSTEPISCKRRLEKDMDDLERRQAVSFIKKSIPGSRRRQLLAAVRGSKSEGSMNRKKSRRMEITSK